MGRRRQWQQKIRKAANIKPYKSLFEHGVAQQLVKKKVKFKYESKRITYNKPHSYLPDFVLPSGIFIEAKGRFTGEDRKKHLLIREQHPEYDIRFVFQRAHQPLRKGSPTTYAMWAEEHEFKWADKQVPNEWLREKKKE